MAGPVAGLLLKKRNACLIGELLAAILEMFIFSSWGVATLFLDLFRDLVLK